jgi:xylan 1,4-beta-xylosidase
MRPLVEISFMPDLLASGTSQWSHYDANITPPKNWDQWYALVQAFVSHLVERYGLEEILNWNFEVVHFPCSKYNFFNEGVE